MSPYWKVTVYAAAFLSGAPKSIWYFLQPRNLNGLQILSWYSVLQQVYLILGISVYIAHMQAGDLPILTGYPWIN